jgi:hypothetical protein
VIKIPFGEYDDFDDCVRHNKDKRDPKAYCGTIQAAVEGNKGKVARLLKQMAMYDKDWYFAEIDAIKTAIRNGTTTFKNGLGEILTFVKAEKSPDVSIQAPPHNVGGADKDEEAGGHVGGGHVRNPHYEHRREEAQPSEREGEPKTPPKGYPESRTEYADPKNYKYPLDTYDHVRAAITYFSNADNRAKYSSDEQKYMWGRITAAAKRQGIDISDEVKERAKSLGSFDFIKGIEDILGPSASGGTICIVCKIATGSYVKCPRCQQPVCRKCYNKHSRTHPTHVSKLTIFG